MSAELLIVGMAAPWHWGREPGEYHDDLAREIGRERIDAFDFEHDPDLVDELAPDLGVELGGDSRHGDLEVPARTDPEARAALISRVRAALYDALDAVLREGWEIIPFRLGGRVYWFTGGESVSGPPTAVYEPIVALDRIGLFEAPLPHPRHR